MMPVQSTTFIPSMKNHWRWLFNPHFTEKKTEAQRPLMTGQSTPKNQVSWLWWRSMGTVLVSGTLGAKFLLSCSPPFPALQNGHQRAGEPHAWHRVGCLPSAGSACWTALLLQSFADFSKCLQLSPSFKGVRGPLPAPQNWPGPVGGQESFSSQAAGLQPSVRQSGWPEADCGQSLCEGWVAAARLQAQQTSPALLSLTFAHSDRPTCLLGHSGSVCRGHG